MIVPPSPGYVVDEEAPAAELPSWLRDMMVTRPNGNGKRTPVTEWLKVVAGVDDGQRNVELTRFVGHLLRKGVDVYLVADLAHLVNKHRFRPPLDREEVDRVIDSIAATELRRRGVSNQQPILARKGVRRCDGGGGSGSLGRI